LIRRPRTGKEARIKAIVFRTRSTVGAGDGVVVTIAGVVEVEAGAVVDENAVFS